MLVSASVAICVNAVAKYLLRIDIHSLFVADAHIDDMLIGFAHISQCLLS